MRLIRMVAALLALSLAAPTAWACDACAQRITTALTKGPSPSAHAPQMLALMDKTDAAYASLKSPTYSVAQASSAAGGARTGSPASPANPPIPKDHPFVEIMERDRALPIPETSYVAPGTAIDKKFTLVMEEGDVAVGNGVIYTGFTVNGTIPGPTLIMDEGDVVEITVENKGEVPHGVSLHAAYTQTSKYLGKIDPGQSRKILFRVTYPGIYMYHCAPGGHAIPMHTLLGQYGMMVVKPKKTKFKMEEVMGRKPDIEVYMIQHELYSSGKDAIEGKPTLVMFNGSTFRYVAEPIKARPGDFVRINFLNVGPNLISTYHLVGIIWDYAYWQGNPAPQNTFVGGQTVLAGPSDSWVVDFRVPPDEGSYLIVNHAFGATTRGAIGVLAASKDAERTALVIADGPKHSKEELAVLKEKAIRTISPFQPGSDELENPHIVSSETKKFRVSIIGNSFYPKVIQVKAGTTIEWCNEDVFTYMSGEFSGIHDVVGYEGPESFSSPMLAYGEKFSMTFTKTGEYEYLCTPHPYMVGVIRVVD